MTPDSLLDPRVKAALDAMKVRDRRAWFNLFTTEAILTDDGNAHDFAKWSDAELFGEDKGYLMSIDRVEDHGLTVYGKFHSDRWGEFETFMRFTVKNDKF